MKKVILVLIFMVAIAIAGVGGYFLGVSQVEKKDKTGVITNETAESEVLNNVEDENKINENLIENKINENFIENNGSNLNEVNGNNDNEKNMTDEESTYILNANGKYKDESETINYYHCSNLEITEQSDNSIKFSINATHGNDATHVNVGEVSGIAKKISVPNDETVTNSVQVAYEFSEEIDGQKNSIIIVITSYRQFQYAKVVEKYATESNPYAGNRVFFAGEYEMIK